MGEKMMQSFSQSKSDLQVSKLKIKSQFQGKEPPQRRPCPQPCRCSWLTEALLTCGELLVQFCQETGVKLAFSTAVSKLEAYINPQGTAVQLQVQATLRELAAPACTRKKLPSDLCQTGEKNIKRNLFWAWHCGKEKLQPPKPSKDGSAWWRCC